MSESPVADVRSTFRSDIEGLRGIAVLLVILFHVGIQRFAGGFIGVDVFFVISGFLISKQLFSEVQNTGRAGLRHFWGRRLRRLVPLLSVTIVATLLAVLAVYSALEWREMTREAGSSMLYVSNLLFARNGQFYFQSATSPYLHTWSLGVEEQFYIGWPLLFVGVALIVRKLKWRLRATFACSVAFVTVVSFVTGLVITRRGSPWAFYSAPTRAWEFGLGALAFAAGPINARLAPVLRVGASWVAGVSVGMAALTFDEFTPMPGSAALLPAGGAALLLTVGTLPQRASFNSLLLWRPLRSLGRVSYGWYLFHWPAIVLAAAATGRHDVTTACVAAAGSLLLAYLATRWIERPVRDSVWLSSSSVVYLSAASLSVLVLAGTVIVNWEAERRLRDPFLSHLEDVRAGRSTSGSAGCVPSDLSAKLSTCVYGPADGVKLVVLVGDSHAAQWAPAVEGATAELGFRLIVRTFGGCPAMDVYVARTGFTTASDACLAFRDETKRILEASSPDLVIMSNTDYSGLLLRSADGGRLGRSETTDAYQVATRQYAAMISGVGARLAVIEDNPSQLQDPIECLALHRSVDECSAPRQQVVPPVEEFTRSQQDALRTAATVSALSTIPLICDARRCLVERDGLIVYADSTHLSAEFTLRMTPKVHDLILDALR